MPVETTTRRVRSADGTSIAYQTAGSGPALVMVDAAGGYREFSPLQPLAALLAARFTVYTYDRRGRGESGDTPPYAVQREVEDLSALIEAAGGSAALYGFSSGAVLALHAALAGLPVAKLALMEPPIPDEEPQPQGTDLGSAVAELVAAGRRGDAVEHWLRGIGLPEEALAGMRQGPDWVKLERVAHTLPYDAAVAGSLPAARLARLDTPALVLLSEASDARFHEWTRAWCDRLPNARSVTLPGEWHGVAPEVLAPVVGDFLTGD